MRYTKKRYNRIYTVLSNLSEERRILEDWIRKRDKKAQRNIETDIYWSYHQIAKSQEKRFNIDDTESIIGDDSYKGNSRERDSKRNMTRLQENNMKTSWIFSRDKNGQKNNLYIKNMKNIQKRKRNIVSENNCILSSIQWSDKANKSKDQKISTKVCQL